MNQAVTEAVTEGGTETGKGRPGKPARVEERRRQILDAAAIVFARHGYHRARTREIAAQAGVAEGTLYNYFATKRELLIALLQRVTAEAMPGAVAHITERDPRGWFAAMLEDRLAMLDRNRALVKAVFPEMIADRELRRAYLREVMTPFLAELAPIAGHILHSPLLRRFDPRVVLPAIAGAVVAAFVVNEHLLDDDEVMRIATPTERVQLVEELTILFLDGLGRRDVAPAMAAGGGES